jgi:tetratricopeptide (TPR) repeat protein
MSVVRRTGAVLLVCGAMLLAHPAGSAEGWGKTMSRAEAIKNIGSPRTELRRAGYLRLAEVGTMEDTPILLSALQDEDDQIRGVAEQSLWGLWMRANDSTADPMFQVALEMMNMNQLPEARAKFTDVIGLKPEFAEAWHRRGEVYVMMDAWDAAFKDFEHALQLNPYHFGALEGMGHCRLKQGDPTAAVEYFTRAIELNPNLWDVYEALERAKGEAERSRT